MAITFDAPGRRRLLTSRNPLPDLAKLLLHGSPDLMQRSVPRAEVGDLASSASVQSLLAGAFDGNVAAARGLATRYQQAATELAHALGEPEPAGAHGRLTLRSHLFSLPLLATVHDSPALSLYQWALVGLRQARQTPVPYPVADNVDAPALVRFERAMSAALTDEVGEVSRIKIVLDVSNDDIGRWTGVSPQAVSAWERGQSIPKSATHNRLRRLVRLAAAFSEALKPDRIPAIFHGREVPMLGGLTYYEALDKDFDVDVLIDIVRHGSGRRPETEAGSRYLDGAEAESLRVLADYVAGVDAAGLTAANLVQRPAAVKAKKVSAATKKAASASAPRRKAGGAPRRTVGGAPRWTVGGSR